MEWFEGLEASALEQATAKGWNKPAADIVADVFKSYTAAQSLIGSDPAAIFKMPKDTTDPTYSSVYDRVVGLSLPKSADEYKFDDVKFKDGTGLEPDDAAWVRDFAVANKLPVAAARALAAGLVSRVDSDLAQSAQNDALAATARENALRATWGSQFEQNTVSVANVVDSLRVLGIPVALDGLAADAYVAANNGLVKLSGQLREATFHGGGNPAPRNDFTAMTPADARAKFDELRQNSDWVTKALTVGTQEARYLDNLNRTMAGAPVQA